MARLRKHHVSSARFRPCALLLCSHLGEAVVCGGGGSSSGGRGGGGGELPRISAVTVIESSGRAWWRSRGGRGSGRLPAILDGPQELETLGRVGEAEAPTTRLTGEASGLWQPEGADEKGSGEDRIAKFRVPEGFHPLRSKWQEGDECVVTAIVHY